MTEQRSKIREKREKIESQKVEGQKMEDQKIEEQKIEKLENHKIEDKEIEDHKIEGQKIEELIDKGDKLSLSFSKEILYKDDGPDMNLMGGKNESNYKILKSKR